MKDYGRQMSHRVALFVTCLADLTRPSVAFAAVKLLEDAGCTVEVPTAQTCCGQPAYNSGAREDAADLARNVVSAFAGYDYVVAPSGSCAGMIKHHYPKLLGSEAQDLADRTWEITSFLTDVLNITAVDTAFDATTTYHDSCGGLRELGIKEQPRTLLASVSGLEIKEAEQTEVCCGFGGLFSVKYPDISGHMANDKAALLEATGADVVCGGDLGCLANIAKTLNQRGSKIQVRHVAEVLAGMTDIDPIGGDK